jgi:exonuclease V
MTRVWERYVEALGLGCPGSMLVRAKSQLSGGQLRGREVDTNAGRTEHRLELVYRRAGAKERSAGSSARSGRRKKRRKGAAANFDTKQADDGASEAALQEEQRLLQLAVNASMASVTSNDGAAASSEARVDSNQPVSEQSTAPRRPASRQSDYLPERTSDDEREEDELAWAVEMSLAGIQSGSADDAAVVLPLSQRSTGQSPPAKTDASQSGQNAVDIVCVSSPDSSPPPSPDKNTASGSIIGRHRFQHDAQLMTAHLESVLQFWMGQRQPIGVTVDETQRCGWCEFEEGCEWR